MRVKTLGEICNVASGGTPSRSQTAYWNGGTIPWIKIGNIKGKYVDKADEYITQEGLDNSSAKMFPKGTILYTIFATLGEVGILTIDACTNQAIAGITVKDHSEILTDYLFYYLKSKKVYVNGMGRGVAQNNINMSILRGFEVPLPDISEQRQIVSVLDKVAKVVEFRQQQLSELDNFIKARFVELFGDPVKNPYEYEKVVLSELAEIKIGPFGSLLHKEDYIEGGHALINPSHIIDGKVASDNKLTISEEKYQELSAYHLKNGDVVMGRRGEMGRCAVVPCDGYLCGTGSLLIRTKGEVTADYIQKIISFPSFKKMMEDMAVGQTMLNLNVPIVSNFQIIKPPMEIQDRYYKFVHQVDKTKNAVQKALEETQMLFDSLMQDYFGCSNGV